MKKLPQMAPTSAVKHPGSVTPRLGSIAPIWPKARCGAWGASLLCISCSGGVYTHLTLAIQTNALDALPDLDAPAAEVLRATGTDAVATVPETVPEKVVKGGSFGKEPEGSNASPRSRAETVNPLPALEKGNVSGMMTAAREGGGTGRRAGLRNRRAI